MQTTLEHDQAASIQDTSDISTFDLLMENIIKLFDKDSFDKQISKAETTVVKNISDEMKHSFGENFLLNFSDLAQQDMEDFYTNGVINPINFKIDVHMAGIMKVIDDNNNRMQKIFKQHISECEKIKKECKHFDIDIDIKEELRLMNKLYPYRTDYTAWKMPLLHLTFEGSDDNDREPCEADFDGLYIAFDFGRTNVRNAIKIIADPDVANYNHDGNDENYFHPHVDYNGTICFGNAETAAQLFWERKELLNIAMLLVDTLGTYNDRSPYKPLMYWTEQKLFECANCGETIAEDYVCYIDNDQSDTDCIACGNCSTYIEKESCRKWKDDYVVSHYHGRLVEKYISTQAFVTNDAMDWVENILSNENFKICNTCNMFYKNELLSLINGKNVCQKCNKEKVLI